MLDYEKVMKTKVSVWKQNPDFPLLNQFFNDTSIQINFRRIDNSWRYQGILKDLSAGFNPFNETVYFPGRSAISDWFRNDRKNLDQFIGGGFVVNELLFGIHDYLHIWSYQCTDELTNGYFSQLVSTNTPLKGREFEDVVFFHIVSEAVATVGLDYWFLSRVSLDKVLDIKTDIKKLTIDMREDDLNEYQKYNPEFNPFTPLFFKELCLFYCRGEFFGFDANSIKNSKLMLKWLKHELRYGQTQRDYTYSWMKYLFTGDQDYNIKSRKTSKLHSHERYGTMLDQIGVLLWEKVNGINPHYFKRKNFSDVGPRFRSNIDPRFSNPLKNTGSEDKVLSSEEKLMFISSHMLNWESKKELEGIKIKIKSLLDNSELKQTELLDELKYFSLVDETDIEPEEIFILL
jgi:hypothetical protein